MPDIDRSSPEYQAKVERLREALARSPGAMTMQLAREIGLPEVEVIRNLPADRAVELDAARWEDILRSLESAGKVRVLVSNAATTIEASGRFGGFSTMGEFFNVQTASLDLHIRWRELASAFAVIKPSHLDGATTHSIQFFDRAGAAALKIFLNFTAPLTPGAAERFEYIRDQFARR